jgi:hypothetical protein
MTGEDDEVLTLTLGAGIVDAAMNALAETSFTYTVGDNTAPMPTAYAPNDSTLTANHPTLKVTFDEAPVVGTGNVYVTKVGSTEATLTIPIAGAVVSGMMVTLDYDYATIGGLDKNTEYFVTFEAGVITDAAGNGNEALTDNNVWKFTTGADFATGIEGPTSGSLEFKVYPNPFVDNVNVDNADKLSRIILTNVAGQRVKDIVSPTSVVQLGDVPSGVYFLTLITKEGAVAKTERIVKR